MLKDSNLLLVKLAPAMVTTTIFGIFPMKDAKKKHASEPDSARISHSLQEKE